VTVTRPDDLYETADAHLAAGDRVAARAGLAQAREIATDEPGTPFAMRRLAEAEARMGRTANRLARRLVMSVELDVSGVQPGSDPAGVHFACRSGRIVRRSEWSASDVRGRSSHMPL
jgi:hypothetical protein